MPMDQKEASWENARSPQEGAVVAQHVSGEQRQQIPVTFGSRALGTPKAVPQTFTEGPGRQSPLHAGEVASASVGRGSGWAEEHAGPACPGYRS